MNQLYIIAVDNIYVNKKICIDCLLVGAQDHLQEVLDKWDSIDDEIWAKIVVLERNRRVAKVNIYTIDISIYLRIYLSILISTTRPTPGRPSSPSMALTRASTGSGSGCPASRTP